MTNSVCCRDLFTANGQLSALSVSRRFLASGMSICECRARYCKTPIQRFESARRLSHFANPFANPCVNQPRTPLLFFASYLRMIVNLPQTASLPLPAIPVIHGNRYQVLLLLRRDVSSEIEGLNRKRAALERKTFDTCRLVYLS